jgi:hypothetical protein
MATTLRARAGTTTTATTTTTHTLAPSNSSLSNNHQSSSVQTLFQSVEKVDSLYHCFAFLITHPDYMVEAASVLHVHVPAFLQGSLEASPSMAHLDTDTNEEREEKMSRATRKKINKSSGLILVMLVCMLMLQIVGLYAFITSLSNPACETSDDCPPTTFCYNGVISMHITGFKKACMSCGMVDQFGEDNMFNWLLVTDETDPKMEKGNNVTEIELRCAEEPFYRNKEGLSSTSVVAMCLVGITVGVYLAKEESEILLTDIFLRRSGWSWWRAMYYDTDEKTSSSAFNVHVVNQARFELFQWLRRFCMQVQIAICTTMVLVTATDAKDFFLDATAVLFVVDIDNLVFRSLMTSSEQTYFLETTKLSLDRVETFTMQVSKFLHGIFMAIGISCLSIWIKANGMNGEVRSVADLPVILTAMFVGSQIVIATVVLFFGSYLRNSKKWYADGGRMKVARKFIRALVYCTVGGTTGATVILNHIWGVLCFILIFALYTLVSSMLQKSQNAVKKHEGEIKLKLEKIKANIKQLGAELSPDQQCAMLARVDFVDSQVAVDDDGVSGEDLSGALESGERDSGGLTLDGIYGVRGGQRKVSSAFDTPLVEDASASGGVELGDRREGASNII